MFKRFLIAALLAGAMAVTSCQRQVSYAEWEGPMELFKAGEDGYNTFRIPGMVVSKKGTVLAFAEARKNSHRDFGDIDLVVKRSEDGGRSWSDIIMVRDDGVNCCSSPTPVVLESGRILMLCTWQNNEVPFHHFAIHWFTMYSDDDGLTWSKPREITLPLVEPDWIMACIGPGHAIRLEKGVHKGRIVASCYHKWERPGDRLWQGRSFYIYSDDEGQTWQRGGFAGYGGNECMSTELANGDIMLNQREFKRWGDDIGIRYQRLVSISKDGGESFVDTWYDPNLPSAICEGSIIRYRHGHERDNWLLFATPTAQTRTELKVKLSKDCGQSWDPIYDGVYDKEAYSDMAELPDGSVGIIYEAGNTTSHDLLVFDIIPAAQIR